MIVRHWHGRVPAALAEAYRQYVTESGVAAHARTPGHRGSLILTRPEGDIVHFEVLSFWDSLEAIVAFAGPTPSVARYFPADDRFLLEREPQCRHWEWEGLRATTAAG